MFTYLLTYVPSCQLSIATDKRLGNAYSLCAVMFSFYFQPNFVGKELKYVLVYSRFLICLQQKLD